MANLIITIISIALVAVAALMGAYYGGTAFSSGQAKSLASTLVSQGQQIAAAWAIQTADNNGTRNIASINALTTGTSIYLSSNPVPPQAAVGANTTQWTVKTLSDTSASVTSAYDGVYVALTTGQTAVDICNQVAIMVAGSGQYPTRYTSATGAFNTLYASGATRKFDCVFSGGSNVTTPNTTDTMYVYYKVF